MNTTQALLLANLFFFCFSNLGRSIIKFKLNNINNSISFYAAVSLTIVTYSLVAGVTHDHFLSINILKIILISTLGLTIVGKIKNSNQMGKINHSDILRNLFVFNLPIFVNYFTGRAKYQFRTQGNNDPFDFVLITKVFESENRDYINSYNGWSAYSDYLAPWLTRLYSLLDGFSPFNALINFQAFNYLIQGILLLSVYEILKTKFWNNFTVSLLFIFSFYSLNSLQYNISQGFWPQIMGTAILFQVLKICTEKPWNANGTKFAQIFFLNVILFFTYPSLLPFSILILILNINLLHDYRSLSKRMIIKYLVYLFAFVLYAFHFLTTSIKGTLDFIFNHGLGQYGWSRKMQEYLWPDLFFLVIVSAVCLMANLIFIKNLRVRNNLYKYSAMVVVLTLGYFYLIFKQDPTAYQTWKFFSFTASITTIGIMTYLFDFDAKDAFTKLSRFSIKNSLVVFIFICSLVTANLHDEFKPSEFVPSTQIQVGEIEGLIKNPTIKFKTLAIATSSVTESMFLGGFLPARKVYFFTPTYYSDSTPKRLPKYDYLIVSTNLLITHQDCRDVRINSKKDYFQIFPSYKIPKKCGESLFNSLPT
jgi:hypothetical protein